MGLFDGRLTHGLQSLAAAMLLCLLLPACSSQAPREAASADDALPELNLNLPADCACSADQETFTFLEKGVNALNEGSYLESLQYFQRYQRIENTERATLEAGIAIAYLSTLPDSPIYDRSAARNAYLGLREQVEQGAALHDPVRIMQYALESFLHMYDQVEQLKQGNASLRSELEKREEAITRLRDLTLGREPAQAGSR
ncbi:MAG: hypothetical protein V2J89_11675 [Halieaceae bacterium]|jgi:hypothetical protein|nr:hypothetical protein [Halieaceae bacterium]